MSGQLLELIIFAGIALFIISKLISTLGRTTEDDPTKSKSFFGEVRSELKDVTDTSKQATITRPSFGKKSEINLTCLVVPENKKEVKEGLADVTSKVPSFNLANFLKGAIAAFKIIIEAEVNGNDELEELVDKRYIEHFKSIASSYGKYISKPSDLTAQVSEIYMFGNNIFVKVLFAGKNITNKIKELHEEWTFTRSALTSGSGWHLTNIDRPQ